MTEPVELHPEAADEIEAAFDWYSVRSMPAARGFLAEVDFCIGRVLEQPDRWPIETASVFRHVFPRYPFILFYRRKTDGIQVLAVAHQKRRPRYWLSRIDPQPIS